MIENFWNKNNILESLDPRAASFNIVHVNKYEDQQNVWTKVELEPCDQKELTKSFHYDKNSFIGMSCIKDENNEVLQGLHYDPNRKSIHIEITACEETDL